MTAADEAATRLRALLGEWDKTATHYAGTRHETTVPLIIANYIGGNVTAETMAQTMADLRAVLDEREQLHRDVAEITVLNDALRSMVGCACECPHRGIGCVCDPDCGCGPCCLDEEPLCPCSCVGGPDDCRCAFDCHCTDCLVCDPNAIAAAHQAKEPTHRTETSSP